MNVGSLQAIAHTLVNGIEKLVKAPASARTELDRVCLDAAATTIAAIAAAAAAFAAVAALGTLAPVAFEMAASSSG